MKDLNYYLDKMQEYLQRLKQGIDDPAEYDVIQTDLWFLFDLVGDMLPADLQEEIRKHIPHVD